MEKKGSVDKMMMANERFKVPDRIFWMLTGLVLLLTWGSILYFYSSLPSRLPVHFGLSGQPDGFAHKNFWTAFFPAYMQLALTGLMIWMYRHPQYSNIPSSMLLAMLPEPWHQKIIMLIRHLLVMVTIVVNLLLAYISLAMISSSLSSSAGLNGWAILGLIGLLLLIVIVYSVWLWRLTKQGIHALQTQPRT